MKTDPFKNKPKPESAACDCDNCDECDQAQYERAMERLSEEMP